MRSSFTAESWCRQSQLGEISGTKLLFFKMTLRWWDFFFFLLDYVPQSRLPHLMKSNPEHAEAPILWPPDAKSRLTGKDPDAGKDWGQEEKGTTEDEMVGWHHWLNGHESEWTPGDGEGPGSLVCCMQSMGLQRQIKTANEQQNLMKLLTQDHQALSLSNFQTLTRVIVTRFLLS